VGVAGRGLLERSLDREKRVLCFRDAGRCGRVRDTRSEYFRLVSLG
jgi:hypothetical protein